MTLRDSTENLAEHLISCFNSFLYQVKGYCFLCYFRFVVITIDLTVSSVDRLDY